MCGRSSARSRSTRSSSAKASRRRALPLDASSARRRDRIAHLAAGEPALEAVLLTGGGFEPKCDGRRGGGRPRRARRPGAPGRLHVRAFRGGRQEHWFEGFEGLESAFRAFGGVLEEVLLDNARALVARHDPATREVRLDDRLL